MASKFKNYFPNGVQPGKIIPYAHKGEWAVHELLPFLFSEIGPFHLAVATFNVSEDSLRPIFFMKDRGELLSVKFLFDNNVRRHKVDMLFFALGAANSDSQFSNVRTSSTHMKLMLCWNDKICISVVGSANMNRNVRHEAGFISTSRLTDYPSDASNEPFNFYKSYFDVVFESDSLPFII